MSLMTVSTTDRMTANVATVTDIYAAFGRGDIPAILDRIAPDCRWEAWADNRAQRAGLPTLLPRIGPAGVADFFVIAGQLEFHDFQLLDTLGSERQVAVEVKIAYTTPTGAHLSDEEVHLWTFNEDQQVVRMRHYVDTAKHIAAFAPVDLNKELARRFVLEHNQAGHVATFDAILAPDCVVHEYLPGVPAAMDRPAYEQFIAMFRAALPDIQNAVEDIVAEGDRVVVRWTGRGTHTGAPLMGMPAGGAPVIARGIYVFRILAGKIVEVWDNWDNLNVVQQLSPAARP
jgi:steroid delta-isomerase-like uncharacterized protein